ncbi:PIN domain-containing protein [Streptomyces mirabilis]|uniref:PIN domain-containing protein n=1 Tax=Streptomyces mirabilis TaxID=68239 RepID=UPI0037FE58A2
MIILDTSILRSFSPEGSSADLLRAIRAVGVQSVAAPWMVLEELAAQQAIKYEEVYERAAHAAEALQHATPWSIDAPVALNQTAKVRDHWRMKWASVVEEIPTSDEALRKALFREANRQAPCKSLKGEKTGSRDAAIWLSAVEYAEAHPDETVYFVSANTKDFGDGTSYPFPMNEDISRVQDRFVLLTSMEQVASRFTEPVAADAARVADFLSSKTVLRSLASLLDLLHPSFRCAVYREDKELAIIPAIGWNAPSAKLSSFDSVQAYRIGGHEWCTAVVEWHIVGTVLRADDQPVLGAVTWTTSALFSLESEAPHLTVLRSTLPRPLREDALDALDLSLYELTTIEESLVQLQQRATDAATLLARLSDYRSPRAYREAWRRPDGLWTGHVAEG